MTILKLDSVTFRRNGVQILDGVNFEVEEGQRWVMLGENGAGKSTILALCGGQAHPTSGTVDILGNRVGRVDLRDFRARIGHVNPRHNVRGTPTATDIVLTGITGTLELPLYWSPSPDDLALSQETLADLGLNHRADAVWPTLSQGERGRTLIARALAGKPELLLLDEPATGLDLKAREQLLDTLDHLAKSNMTSLLVTHHLEEIPATTTHAVLVKDGTITASGPINDVITSEHISHAFNFPIRVKKEDGRWTGRRTN